MKFSINRLAFLNALKKTNGIISKNPVLPILTGIRLELKDDVLTLITSDGVISIKEKVESTKENEIRILAEGGVVLESRFLVDGISKLDSESVTLEVVSGSLTKISGGSAKFNINGSELLKYPSIDFGIADKQFNIDSKELANALIRTTYACGITDDKAILEGLNITLSNEALTFTGTNRYRIASFQTRMPIPASFNIAVPLQALNEVKRHLTGTVSVSVSNKEITFKSNETLIKSRLIDGLYPSVAKAIAFKFDNYILIERSKLIAAISRSSLMKKNISWTVMLNLENNEAKLITNSEEFGSTEEVLLAYEVNAEDGFVKFNGQYILDALKALENDTIKLKFGDSMSPIGIEEVGNESTVQVVMALNPGA